MEKLFWLQYANEIFVNNICRPILTLSTWKTDGGINISCQDGDNRSDCSIPIRIEQWPWLHTEPDKWRNRGADQSIPIPQISVSLHM